MSRYRVLLDASRRPCCHDSYRLAPAGPPPPFGPSTYPPIFQSMLSPPSYPAPFPLSPLSPLSSLLAPDGGVDQRCGTDDVAAQRAAAVAAHDPTQAQHHLAHKTAGAATRRQAGGRPQDPHQHPHSHSPWWHLRPPAPQTSPCKTVLTALFAFNTVPFRTLSLFDTVHIGG